MMESKLYEELGKSILGEELASVEILGCVEGMEGRLVELEFRE